MYSADGTSACPPAAPACAGARIDLAGLKGRRRQLFHEQRHAIRSRDDLLEQLARQLLVADDGASEIAAVVIGQGAEAGCAGSSRTAANGIVRLVITSRIGALPIWPAIRSTTSIGRWIGPVKILDQYQARAAVARATSTAAQPHRASSGATPAHRERSHVDLPRRRQAKQLADQRILLLVAGRRCRQGIHAGAPNWPRRLHPCEYQCSARGF